MTMNGKHRFSIITQSFVLITAALLIGCVDNPLIVYKIPNGQNHEDVIGKIVMHQTGGFAGVSHIITIEEKKGSILLASIDDRTNQRLESLVSPQDVEKLWQKLEANDIFTLPTNREMLANIADGFGYEITVQRGEQQNQFFVYAPDQLIEGGETRYNAIVQAIEGFADSQLQEKASGIEGAVTDLDGKPVAGMRVFIVSGTTGFPEIAAETNEEGHYRIGSVPPGTFKVAVHDRQGTRIGIESVTVRSGETSTLNFVIPIQTAKEFTIADMPINGISVLLLESFPVQVHIVVDGFLRDGCTTLNEITQRRDGNTISVHITTKRPQDAVCIQVIKEVQERVPLEGGFLPGRYKVIVNDVEEEFEI